MKELLEKYKAIIAKYEIVKWDSEPSSYRLKAILRFTDNSQLIIKDYLFPTGRKYSFRWQEGNVRRKRHRGNGERHNKEFWDARKAAKGAKDKGIL